DELSAALSRCVHDGSESFSLIVGFVQTIAVRGFDQQDVGPIDWDGVGEHRATKPSEVAAKQDGLVTKRHPRTGRAKQVPRIDELDVSAGDDRGGTVVANRLQL